MISLNSQLISLLFSFLYGIVFFVFIKINYSILFNVNKVIKILGTFFIMIDMALGYFVILKFINFGVIHIYFFVVFLFGWFIGYITLGRYVKK